MDTNKPAEDIDDIFATAMEAPEGEAEQLTPGTKFTTTIDIADGDPNLHDHEAEAALYKERDRSMGVEVPDQPKRKFVEVNNPAMTLDPVAEMHAKMDEALSGQFSDLKVEVTTEERDRFVRAALFDSEMRFEVDIAGINATVTVAIPTETFTASAALALDRWEKAGALNQSSNTQWILAFQQLHVWYQVRAVNGKPTEWSALFLDDELPKVSTLLAHASDPENLAAIRDMSAPRWRMLVEASRIAELKYKLCVEAWHDRSFFTPAGIA